MNSYEDFKMNVEENQPIITKLLGIQERQLLEWKAKLNNF